jgi:hypothetical protein
MRQIMAALHGLPCASPRTAEVPLAYECDWSTYEWIHNRKRTRLVTLREEKQARSFSNLNVLSCNRAVPVWLHRWGR